MSLSPTAGLASPKAMFASSPALRTRHSHSPQRPLSPIPFLSRNASPATGNFGQKPSSPYTSKMINFIHGYSKKLINFEELTILLNQ